MLAWAGGSKDLSDGFARYRLGQQVLIISGINENTPVSGTVQEVIPEVGLGYSYLVATPSGVQAPYLVREEQLRPDPTRGSAQRRT